jgi:hypothetical protein
LREMGYGRRMAIDGHFKELKSCPNRWLELGDNEAIKESVARGVGIECERVSHRVRLAYCSHQGQETIPNSHRLQNPFVGKHVTGECVHLQIHALCLPSHIQQPRSNPYCNHVTN